MIQASVRLFCVITCVSAGMPAQRSVVRDDGMRTQQAHAAHAAKRPQSSVPGGQEVRVSDDLAMGSTDESNNETKLTNSEAAGNQGKANIDTGNGMQLKTFTPGVEDVDGMPASKGEGGHSYVQIEGDLTALGGGHQGVEAEDKPGPDDDVTDPTTVTPPVTPPTTPAATGKQVFKPDKGTALEAHPGGLGGDSLFKNAEEGVKNIMYNLNVLAKGAANQQVHLKSHREAIVQLKDKFYELKSAILVKMGILKDRLKKMQDGMGKAQEYEDPGTNEAEDPGLPNALQALEVKLPKADGSDEEHKPLQATNWEKQGLEEAKDADGTSLYSGKTKGANVEKFNLGDIKETDGGGTAAGTQASGTAADTHAGLGEQGEEIQHDQAAVDDLDTPGEEDDGPE